MFLEMQSTRIEVATCTLTISTDQNRWVEDKNGSTVPDSSKLSLKHRCLFFHPPYFKLTSLNLCWHVPCTCGPGCFHWLFPFGSHFTLSDYMGISSLNNVT